MHNQIESREIPKTPADKVTRRSSQVARLELLKAGYRIAKSPLTDCVIDKNKNLNCDLTPLITTK